MSTLVFALISTALAGGTGGTGFEAGGAGQPEQRRAETCWNDSDCPPGEYCEGVTGLLPGVCQGTATAKGEEVVKDADSATADDDSDKTDEMRRANGGLVGRPAPRPNRPRPRPRPRHECWNAWDCPGTGEYCYRGYHGNHCRYDSGVGSICQRNSDCGWLGYQQMHCHWGRCRTRRWRRLDKGDSADDSADVTQEALIGLDKVDAPEKSEVDSTDGQGSGLGEESEDADSATPDHDSDETDEMRRANGGLGLPRPEPRPRPPPRHECWNAWDCPGTGEYCYQGYYGNYCRYASGVGSLCQSDSDCGYLGYQQMRCNWQGRCQTGWRRLDKGDSADDSTDVTQEADSNDDAADATQKVEDSTDGQGSGLGEESDDADSATADDDSDETDEMRRANGELGRPAPRPNRPRPRPRPRHECWNAWDCPGTGEYCYRGYHGNHCRYDSGVGSICQRDNDCGWLGYQQMHCHRGRCRTRRW